MIPYGVTIEVPMGVSMNPNVGSINLCRDFEDIEIMLISTCEMPTPHSQVYQYEEAVSLTAGATVFYNMTTGAQNSTAKFSVHWPALPPFTENTYRRTLAQSDALADSLKSIVDSLGEKLSNVDSIEERLNRVDSLEKKLNSLGSLLFIICVTILSVVVVLAVLAVLTTFCTASNNKDKKKQRSPTVAVSEP